MRKIGNIGAHMEKDINLIVDIEEGEAQALIELIELLFEEWYIEREKRTARLAKLKEISGRKRAAKETPNVLNSFLRKNRGFASSILALPRLWASSIVFAHPQVANANAPRLSIRGREPPGNPCAAESPRLCFSKRTVPEDRRHEAPRPDVNPSLISRDFPLIFPVAARSWWSGIITK